MSIFEWVVAAIQLGLPMAVMSWLMFNWLYGAGQLPRDAGHKAIREHLAKLKKQHKKSKSRSGNYLYKQWLFFGGGFYGLAVLWTLLVIEVSELIGFIISFDLTALLENGIIALMVSVVVAQFGNILAAMLWFSYWPSEQGSTVVIWFLMAYGGYLLGIHFARERQTLHQASDLISKNKWRRRGE
ncbi:hypothetical protein PHACT_10305 [Pseudohongiella acticola]|jgi:hypothetical protein|uniref:Uncharacterized protein n=2 Tax=Pseudohongiella acticola TaxID=1524254 RepID=A0A1E8CLX9_9GAMM|nr:hypothetical protein [Pseudohongiella acticola]OFE13481.1 hypothetical protein PHACT_10305 [Pseudohongiella acticola]